MAGHRKFKDLVAPILADPERRARVEQYREELRREIALHELRRARRFTQVQLADAMGKPQSAISRIERETDLYLSTLRSYVEAMGGELELTAVFPDGRVPITTFRDLPAGEIEEADDGRGSGGEHADALARAG
jgi:transcriptional regulator with XRE-family HTH domain